MIDRVRSRWAQALVALACVAAVAACGGGVGSGGTGAPSVTLGTVTGFGSIVVDGVRFDDREARIETEDRPGPSILTEARLGHRIEVEFESEGVAQRVRVEAELRGAVAELVSGGFKVLQQTVLVNTDPASGPVTQFGDGYTTLGDVAPGHVVEVHGVPRLQGGGYVVQATRIDRRPALLATAFVRVSGLVSDLGSDSFKLGDLTVGFDAAAVVPAGRSLADGQRVVVLARRPASAAASTLEAGQVRIKERVNGPVAADLAGVVSALNTAQRRFDLGGIAVDYAGAEVDPAGALDNRRYVRVRGRFAGDGSFVATRVQVRKLDGEPESELRGTVADFDAATQRFTVRGVTVSAAGASLHDCPGGLADGLFVEAEGTLTGTGVQATEVKCEAEPQGAVVEREGTAGSVDSAAKTFRLATANGPVAVRWGDLTYFRDVTPATLDGQPVEVDGVFVGGVLVATKIERED